MQRQAKLLSNSTIVPTAYRAWDEKKGVENPHAISNCVVALNMSNRLGVDPIMVMQNLHPIEGRPSWSSQWIIASINQCGRFSPLRFELKDNGTKDVEYEVTKWVDRQRVTSKYKTSVRDLECVAWAIERESGERITSPAVSIEMAVKEGWYGKNGSKWQTIPKLMLPYRAATFFGRLYVPEILMGMQSVEEVLDIIDVSPDGSSSVTTTSLRKERTPPQRVEEVQTENEQIVDQDTGEVSPETAPEPKPEPSQQQAEEPIQAQPAPVPAGSFFELE